MQQNRARQRAVCGNLADQLELAPMSRNSLPQDILELSNG